MRFFIALLFAAALSLPSLAEASNGTVRPSSGGTKWALFSRKHAQKAPKAKGVKQKAPRASRVHRAKSSH